MTHDIDIDEVSDGDMRFMALACAAVAHNGQTYYGQEPFVNHLLDVSGTVVEFGLGSDHMVAAALLHDIVEDTDTTLQDLRELFPEEVVLLVDSVTDILGPNGEDLPRVQRRQLTRAKTKLNRRAVGLKGCDRISNWRAGIAQLLTDWDTAVYYLAKYNEEYPAFRADLYQEGEYDAIWAELDRLQQVTTEALVDAA